MMLLSVPWCRKTVWKTHCSSDLLVSVNELHVDCFCWVCCLCVCLPELGTVCVFKANSVWTRGVWEAGCFDSFRTVPVQCWGRGWAGLLDIWVSCWDENGVSGGMDRKGSDFLPRCKLVIKMTCKIKCFEWYSQRWFNLSKGQVTVTEWGNSGD